MVGRARNEIDLQATLSSASAMPPPFPQPHHPITCVGRLALHEDGSLECEHITVGPGDVRTTHCIDHSIAMLVIELALNQENPP